jgi:DNA-directed RNA polymerase specialized sigma24 family protein
MDFKDFEKIVVAKARWAYIPDRAFTSGDTEQELRIALWSNQGKYDPKRGSPRTFGERIMRNKLIDLVRHAQKSLPRYRVRADDLSQEDAVWRVRQGNAWGNGDDN